MAEKPKKSKSKLEQLRQIAKEFASDTGGNKWLKMKEQRTWIRILPNKDNPNDPVFFYKNGLHYGFKVDNNDRAFPCMTILGEKTCPVCQVIEANKDTDNPDVVKALERLKQKVNYLINVVDRKDKENPVKMYNAGVMIMKAVFRLTENEDYGDITDPLEGFDLIIVKEGEGRNTKYSVEPRPKVVPIGIENWQELAFDLEKEAYREIPSRREYINMLMDQHGDVLNIRPLFREELIKLKKAEAEAEAAEEPEEEEPDADEDAEDDLNELEE